LLQPAYAPIVVERDRNSVFFITPCNCRPCAPQATLLVKPPSFSLALRVHLFSALLRHKQPPTFHRLFPGASVLTHRPPAWLQTSSSLAEARLPGAEPHDAAAATARLDAGQHALSFGCHEHCKRQISNVASIFFGKLSYDIVTQHIEKISIMTTVMIVYIVRYLSAGIQEQKSRQ
jgi:hypothetical protein